MFQELIEKIRHVQGPEDITNEHTDELVNAAIAACVGKLTSKENMSIDEALVITKEFMNDHISKLINDPTGK